jgi:hypothetical protein
MEHEYNGQLCEDTFDGLLHAGAFGSPQDMPRELQGEDIHFRFTSPLHDAIERKEAATFYESADLIARAMELDPSAGAQYDTSSALKAALEGIGVEARHIRTETQVRSILSSNAQQAEAEQSVELAKGGAQAVRDAAQASQALAA